MQLKKSIKAQEKKWRENYKVNGKTSNRMAISMYSLIITLNVNGLNAQIKRQRELIGLKKKTNHQQNSGPFYILPTIDWQTESEGVGKEI